MRAPESGNTYYTIFGLLERETEKAWLWKMDGMRAFWIPKSQSRNLAIEPNEDGELSIEVKEWILKEKGVHHDNWFSEEELKESNPKQVDTSKSNREFNLDNLWEDDIPF